MTIHVRKLATISPWVAMAGCMLTLVAWGVLFLPPHHERLIVAAVVLPVGIVTDYILHKIQTGKPNLPSSIITSAIVTVLLPPDIAIWQATPASVQQHV